MSFTGPLGPRHGLPAVAGRDGRIFLLAESADRAPELWVGDSSLTNLQQLSRVNREVESYSFGVSRLVRWRDLDGEMLRGVLLLPAGYVPGHRYPLLTYVYPGATPSSDVNRFASSGGYGFLAHMNFQLFATRGIAVFLPDSRVRGDRLPRDVASSVLPGINALIDMGIADSERLGVMGHSWGGNATLALLTDTPRFRAAVDYAGVVDVGAGFSAFDVVGPGTSMGWSTENYLKGLPWTEPQRYVETSPLYRLDRVTTPLLVLHGAEDRQTPAGQGAAVFVALRRLGRKVTYVSYPGEPHVIAQHANVIDLCTRVVDWFEEYLAPRN